MFAVTAGSHCSLQLLRVLTVHCSSGDGWTVAALPPAADSTDSLSNDDGDQGKEAQHFEIQTPE